LATAGTSTLVVAGSTSDSMVAAARDNHDSAMVVLLHVGDYNDAAVVALLHVCDYNCHNNRGSNSNNDNHCASLSK